MVADLDVHGGPHYAGDGAIAICFYGGGRHVRQSFLDKLYAGSSKTKRRQATHLKKENKVWRHELHDLRNVIAHWPFSATETGLWCDYIEKCGNLSFRKPGTKTKDREIEYSEFDSFDVEASELNERLQYLEHSVTPITDFSDDLRHSIEEAISSSDNVVRFPNKIPNEEKDETGK